MTKDYYLTALINGAGRGGSLLQKQGGNDVSSMDKIILVTGEVSWMVPNRSKLSDGK